MRLVELTQRLNDSAEVRPLYVNPEHVTSLHVIREDGTGIVIDDYNGTLHVNESIQYVAAACADDEVVRNVAKRKKRRRPRKG